MLAINSDEILLVYIYSSLLPRRHEAGHRISSCPAKFIYTSPSPTRRSTLPDTPIIHSSPTELNLEAGADHSYLMFSEVVYSHIVASAKRWKRGGKSLVPASRLENKDCIWILLHCEAFLSSMQIYCGLFPLRWLLTTVMQC